MADDVFYLETGKETDVFERSWKTRLPVLIKGPTGCGKTRFVRHMAAKLGLDLITVSCNEDTSATDVAKFVAFAMSGVTVSQMGGYQSRKRWMR